jgi:DNA repair protein RecN (Recombination protein N)
MLHELRVRNLLLIDMLEMKLEPGFNVMTGETGAGKSVVIGALQLVLGGRANPNQIRPGADVAEVEALFDLAACPEAIERLRLSNIDQGDELVVRRSLLPAARSRAYLNGRLCAVSELSQLAPFLADIASQHESVSLTDVSTHLGYLDSFGDLEEAREQIGSLVDQLGQLRAEVSRLREIARDRAERQEFLLFQLNAIEEADPKPGEIDDLKSERTRLRNAARLTETAGNAVERLSRDDSGLCDQLRTLVSDLSFAVDIDPSLSESASTARDALEQLVECSRALERYAQSMQSDPQRLEAVESRLYQLEQLLRRHGPTELDAVVAGQRLRGELEELGQVDDALRELQQRFDEALRRAGKLAFALSRKRTKAATALADGIGKELAALGMGGARVLVEVARHGGEGDLMVEGAKLTSEGVDRVEFLIAPNKGIEPRPLRKIASGGELSRALLAIKRVLASQGPAGLYVFDEVDAGVGGAVAERIGQALADIARHRQVLCITHLAPIAALADAHFVVKKTQTDAVARTDVVRVTGEDRVREVARMLSGKSVTKASMQAASEMIDARG